jgi:hypothetical protein
VNPLYGLLAVLLLGACAQQPEPLVVKQFQLRDQVPKTVDEPMVSMEKTRRLRGSVSLEERRQKLGQYYTLIWSDPIGVGQGEVEVVFQYQQGATASLVKRMVRNFPSGAGDGKAEFAVIGDDYFNHGKVLAWKATLMRGKRTLATKQSYLWQ